MFEIAAAVFIFLLALFIGYFIGVLMMLKQYQFMKISCTNALKWLDLDRPDRARAIIELAVENAV